jgi:cytochrome b pre-mRNA-processing protein 3
MVFKWLRSETGQSAAYRAVVDLARDPWFYSVGTAADTVDGRFDMIALILSVVITRLEASGPSTMPLRQGLREQFVDDMDTSVRELGVGDLAVGKHVKRMVSALDGRLNAYRLPLVEGNAAQLFEALERNLYRGDPPSSHGPDLVVERILKLFERLKTISDEAITGGRLEPVQ